MYVYQGFEAQLRRAGIPPAEIARKLRPVVKEAREKMGTFLGTIDHGGNRIKPVLWDGRPQQEITTVAKHLRAELVAVGTTGRSGLPYILLGSIAEHFLREVACDVRSLPASNSRKRQRAMLSPHRIDQLKEPLVV